VEGGDKAVVQLVIRAVRWASPPGLGGRWELNIFEWNMPYSTLVLIIEYGWLQPHNIQRKPQTFHFPYIDGKMDPECHISAFD
jgi:hypothetical protein